jgi:SOS response regulatory protein OraA/RecX
MGMKEISDRDYDSTFYQLFEKRKLEVAHLSKLEQKKKIHSYLSYRGWEHPRIYNALNELL